jgi:hypothetical protein
MKVGELIKHLEAIDNNDLEVVLVSDVEASPEVIKQPEMSHEFHHREEKIVFVGFTDKAVFIHAEAHAIY